MKRNTWFHVVGAVAAGAIGLAASQVWYGDIVRAAVSDDWQALPEAVRATFEAKRPGEMPTEIEHETEDGREVYEAEYRSAKGNADITVDAVGALVMVKTKLDAKDLPETVKKSIETNYPGAKVREAESVSLGYYAIDLRAHGRKVEVIVQPDGKIGPNPEDDDETEDDDAE